jgi:ATP-dependent helicase/DNAse subunit B
VGDVHASQVSEQKALGEAIARKRPLEGISLSIQMPADELLRRINVEAFHRVDDYDSPFDGVLNDERIVEELGKMLGPAKVFSPTQIESYSSCPFRFFLNSVLRIEPRPELELEITGKDQGTFVHEVAFRLYSQLRSSGMKMNAENLDSIENLARAIARAELATMKFSGPAWDAFQARMAGSAHRKGLLRAFLEYEVANPTPYEPSHFELSFGRAKPDSCDPSSIDTPVELDLGEGSNLLLAGRVDRIDIDPDGKFLVIDYKTGMLPKLSDVKEGKSLQVQLYMQAVQKLLKDSHGVGGIFYLVKNEAELEYSTIVVDEPNALALKNVIGRKRCLDQPIEELVTQTNALVAGMLSDMRHGIFHPALSEKDCKAYCDYKQVCRFDALRVMDMGGE